MTTAKGLPPVVVKADHCLQHCQLPTKRRRWLGLMAACAVCGRAHALRVVHQAGVVQGSLSWVPLEPCRENR